MATAALAGCTGGIGVPDWCDAPVRAGTLADDLPESSGVAISRDRPELLWTHNDSGYEPELFAVDSTGALRQRIRIEGAENHDWEDIALGPCANDGRDCLYIGDIGDNTGGRDEIRVYRVPEPEGDERVATGVESFRFAYPDGPHNAEALFVLPDGTLYIITTGEDAGAGVYRARAPLRAGERTELERVDALGTEPRGLASRVTGAGATPDGRWAVVRTYTAAELYRIAEDGGLAAAELDRLSLGSAAEPQGEAIDVRDDGAIVLTSEAGPGNGETAGPVTWIRCRLP